MTYRDELISYISDEYKGVYGMRPRWDWASMSDADLKAEADRLEVEVVASIAADKAREDKAAVDFEVALLDIIDAGAKDRETAIRWLREADEDYARDGFFEWDYGLRYGYLAEKAA